MCRHTSSLAEYLHVFPGYVTGNRDRKIGGNISQMGNVNITGGRGRKAARATEQRKEKQIIRRRKVFLSARL